MPTTSLSKEENIFQKERRLKARKQTYIMSYRKGLFMVNKEELCKWIMQDEVLIRIHKAGNMNDDTEFCNITVEGFIPQSNK